MPTLFFFLSIIALIGLIIGIIKPSKVKLTSRKKVILWFGGSFIVFIILIGATSPVDKTQLSVQENKPADTTVVADQTPEQLLESSYKAEIKKIGTTKFSYRDMKIEDADNYRPAGSKMVTISVNIDDFYKKDSLIRDTGILSSNLFQKSLDTSIPMIDYIVWFYGNTRDSYGNDKQDVVLVYATSKDTLEKINWGGFDRENMCEFLKSHPTENMDNACNETAIIK